MISFLPIETGASKLPDEKTTIGSRGGRGNRQSIEEAGSREWQKYRGRTSLDIGAGIAVAS